MGQPTPAAGARRARIARWALPAAVFVFLSVVRTDGIWDRFWMLGDQIRDWEIALGPFSGLPLVGPATHVGGYTVGPAFYWILWGIRVAIGPLFDNLPHAGGIGQALLGSAADAWLAAAIATRIGSVRVAAAAALLVGTAPLDLALAAVIWNPVMGASLAKAATAAVLTRWPERSRLGAGVTAALAWAAVHAYTGAVFVALGVFAAIVLPPLAARRWRAAAARAAVTAGVVAALQVPYVMHRLLYRTGDAMGAVSGSLERVLTGATAPRVGESAASLAEAIDVVQVGPWHLTWIGWLVAGCAVVVLLRRRRDHALLAVTVLPLALAVGGYAFWLGEFDAYYYFSLMPAAVLVVLLATTAHGAARASRALGAAWLALAILILPARLKEARSLHRMPEYATMVRASRQMVQRGVPLRRIEADFLPPTASPDFLYRVLGGTIAGGAEWMAVVAPDGTVTYRKTE